MSVGEGWYSWFYTPVCSYKFDALTVYLLSTFTVPPIGGAFGIQSNICGGAFLRRAPSCIFELHKGILDSSCLLILLIYTSNKENSSTT